MNATESEIMYENCQNDLSAATTKLALQNVWNVNLNTSTSSSTRTRIQFIFVLRRASAITLTCFSAFLFRFLVLFIHSIIFGAYSSWENSWPQTDFEKSRQLF